MACEARPTKIQNKGRDFGGENRMVTLWIKDDKEGSAGFAIYEHLLCNASAFFKAAFQGDGAEEGQTSLCLPGVDYDTMNQFVPWLYSGRLSREAGEMEQSSLYWVAARLNTLALTYELSGLTEEAVVLMKGYLDDPKTTDISDALPSADHIAEIYRKSPVSNPMRNFVVELFGTKLQLSFYASGALDSPYSQKCPGFTSDLFVELGKKIMNSEKELRNQIAVSTTNNAILGRERDQYLQESRRSDRRVDELEEYLSQNYDVDPRDI